VAAPMAFVILFFACREMKIVGATVFRGLEGYGETAEMHNRLMRHDQAILISIIDTAENLARLTPVSDVQVVRVQKKAFVPDEKGG